MFSCCRPLVLHELDLGEEGNPRYLSPCQETLPTREQPSPACQLSQDLLASAVTVDTH